MRTYICKNCDCPCYFIIGSGNQLPDLCPLYGMWNVPWEPVAISDVIATIKGDDYINRDD